MKQPKLLIHTYTEEDLREAADLKRKAAFTRIIVVLVIAVIVLLIMRGCAHAVVVKQEFVAGYSIDAWANAIHKAEGNDNYGILSVSCTKGEGCRKVCKNTVRNNWKRYNKTTDSPTFEGYLSFLANRYCPIGASNDPNNLNKNWKRNVYRILRVQTS